MSVEIGCSGCSTTLTLDANVAVNAAEMITFLAAHAACHASKSIEIRVPGGR